MASIFEKNITDGIAHLHHSLGLERSVNLAGPIQRLDPRVKLIATLCILIAVSLSKSLPSLAALYGSILAIGILGKISFKSLLSVWIVLPFFSLFLAIPLLFSFVTPGSAVFSVGSVTVTIEGVSAAIFFLLRVAASVTIVQVLLATTRWDKLLKALHVMGVPSGIIFVLSLTYRYIFVLLTNMIDMVFARKSRMVGRSSAGQHRQWAGGLVGTLFAKTFMIGREVNEAMVSRGFRGDVKTYDSFAFGYRDVIGLCIAVGISIACVRFL